MYTSLKSQWGSCITDNDTLVIDFAFKIYSEEPHSSEYTLNTRMEYDMYDSFDIVMSHSISIFVQGC